MAAPAGAHGSDSDERARATEEQMTDDERFSFIKELRWNQAYYRLALAP